MARRSRRRRRLRSTAFYPPCGKKPLVINPQPLYTCRTRDITLFASPRKTKMKKLFISFMIATCTCGVCGDDVSDLRKEVESLKKEVAELKKIVLGSNETLPQPVPPSSLQAIGTSRDLNDQLRMLQATYTFKVTASSVSEIPQGSEFKTDRGLPLLLRAYFSGFQLQVTPSQEMSRTTDIGKIVRKYRISLFVQTNRTRGGHWYSESFDPKSEYGSWDDFTYPLRLTNGNSFVEIAKPMVTEDQKPEN